VGPCGRCSLDSFLDDTNRTNRKQKQSILLREMDGCCYGEVEACWDMESSDDKVDCANR
jgi:hypothetical protein